MKLLFDTHAFLWWDSEPERLSSAVLEQCLNPENELILSMACIWEIQVKSQLGKLTLHRTLADIIQEQQEANNLDTLPIFLEHVLALQQLPDHHRDPFDRMLVAQAKVENAALLTRDPMIKQYSVEVLW